ncbi:hypothetical protein H0H93_005560 [Arthromyces matolae]|nr:hypothetical protein H0H93_005560 [Arthromyces matolae]
MIIIRPQILVFASFISLVLLLVSATPIQSSLNVVSGADKSSNALVPGQSITDSAILPSESQPVPPPDTIKTIRQLSQKIKEVPKALTKLRNDLLAHLMDLASSILSLSEAEGKDLHIEIGQSIGYAKAVISEWRFLRQDGIEKIKACEEAVAKKNLPRIGYIAPEEVVKLLNKLNDETKSIGRGYPKKDFRELNTRIVYLTLTEQESIKDKLEEGYRAVAANVARWTSEKDRKTGEAALDVWNSLNSLVDKRDVL